MLKIMPIKNTVSSQTGAPPKALILAIKKLLRPLVRLLLSFQITLPFLVEILKEVYVDVAEKDFPLDNKKQTDTRISMLTGVHRKDTKRLRHQEAEEENYPETVSIGVQLVTKWMTDPDFLDKDGKPRRLALKENSSDSSPDFEQLVQSVCKQDMRARVILDEWMRLGIASLVDDQWVSLDTEGFIPNKGIDEKAFYLGMNISDHLEAINHNLLTDTPPFLERCVYYSGLSDRSIQVLEDQAKEKGMAVLQDLNKKAMKLQKTDQKHFTTTQDQTADTSTPHRMNFGLYFFSQPEESDDERA